MVLFYLLYQAKIDSEGKLWDNRYMAETITFGEYVRRLRRHKGWGLNELAAASGLSVSYLSRVENEAAIPKLDSVVRLRKALDGDMDRMLELAKCLPEEILERVLRRAVGDTQAKRRGAGAKTDDQDYGRALVENLDGSLREALAAAFGLSQTDVEGLVDVLGRIAKMPPLQRQEFIKAIATLTKGAAE